MEMQQLLADINKAIDEYKAAGEALRGVILGQGYIVKCGGLYLAFDIDGDRNVSNPRNAQPHQATRFTRADAERVAANVKNGLDEAGSTIHVRNAIDEALIEQIELRDRIGAYLANSPSQRLEMAASA